jgi:hypothetical protein
MVERETISWREVGGCSGNPCSVTRTTIAERELDVRSPQRAATAENDRQERSTAIRSNQNEVSHCGWRQY